VLIQQVREVPSGDGNLELAGKQGIYLERITVGNLSKTVKGYEIELVDWLIG
jgi:hypothetical protein